ncbi:endopeptidase La, partial [bacterium]|nr:endopeptidase La [bacterium]
EQMRVIKEELSDEAETEFDELRKKIEKAKMPKEAKEAADKELQRLSRIPPASSEYTVVRTYLDWLIEIPWSKKTKDNLNINSAQDILDADHYGLEKIKKRVLEYLAVRKLKKDMKGPILCFVGPPGVGKTSLGKSIARALGRKFIRMSLGGIRDEAEIRGHRRTYVGALPGRIVQGIKKSGTINPVFMLDEIDKVGTDFRGDPSSALLEVLDPEQNNAFSDHYLDVSLDLSKVLFIATANLTDPIIPALKDRMETIALPGYTIEEKLKIAKKFLLPKQIKEHGLKENEVRFTDAALRLIIGSHTKEAGVRNLEREIASVLRGIAKEKAQNNSIQEVIKSKDIEKFLGPIKFYSDIAERTSKSGVATGLAWTSVGGDILFIESTSMSGKGELVLTGHLGDVMKESARAALSFIRSKSKDYGIKEDFFSKNDIHIHVPAGAIPKDGPSAGTPLFISLLSLITGKKVRHDIAMTGEITLRGIVLPVGGIKEKVLAAKQAGILDIIMPEKNKNDVKDIPNNVRKNLTFHYVKEMDDVIPLALEN